MNILITGVAGFIGYHLCNRLCNKGYSVTGIDNINDYYDPQLKLARLELLKKHKKFYFRQIDLNDLSLLNGKYDLAINLAAQAGVRIDPSKNFLYEQSNVNGFIEFLNFCKKNSIDKVIYASSSSVYSGLDQVSFSEDLILGKPTSHYAETKVFNEKYAYNCSKKYGKFIGLRFFTVYGPYGRPDMAYFSFTNKILNNKKIEVFNDGFLKRDMTYIDDVIDGIESSIEYIERKDFKHEIFNLGNNKPIEISYLIKQIENYVQKKAIIEYVLKSNEVRITNADCTKSKKLLGYNAKTDVDVGLGYFFDWYKKYYKIGIK